MAEIETHLIEFLDGDRPKTALVLQAGPKKLQTVDANGKRGNINSTQVVCSHEQTANLDSAAAAINKTEERIIELLADLDPELLWETSLDAGTTGFATLAEAYFSSRGSHEIAAVFRKMLDDPLHYKRKGLVFTTRSREQVAEQEEARLKAQKNKAAREQLGKQLKRFQNTRKQENFLPEDEETLQLLERYLFDMHGNSAGQAMRKLHKDEARQHALRILEAAGRIPEGSDPILLVAGLKPGFSAEELAPAAALLPFDPKNDREDRTDLDTFSIDDAETREVDDALSLEEIEGGWRVGIHIADLASFLPPLSELDLLGRRRTISAYMPGGTITMLPDRLSCDLASLVKGEARPALSLFVDFDQDYSLRSSRFARTIIRVADRLTYESAEAILTDDTSQRGDQLRTLSSIAEALFNDRLQKGAFSIDKPEYKVRVQDGVITIKTINNRLKSQMIVQESMVLYNGLAGSFAIERGIPVIFRTQGRPKDKTFPSGQVIEFRPGRMGEIFKQLSPAQLSLEPGSHFGLGVEHYIQSSSPLRRYADLVMQRQIAAAAADKEPPYERDDLFRILAAAEAAEKDIRAVERKAIKYWTLEYIRRQDPKTVYEGTVSRNNGGNSVVELSGLPAVGVIRAPIKTQPGEPIRVRLKETAPSRELLVLDAVE